MKPVAILTLLASLSATATACKRTCSASGDSGGKCTYVCTHMCESLPANEARNNFLSALQSAGYSCSASGATGVVCNKGGNFGSCYDHYWNCGSGC